MMRSATVALAVAVLTVACSGGGADVEVRPSTTLTTLTTTPIRPTGAADAVRRWVTVVADGEDDDAFAGLAPVTQEAIGGREGYAAARPQLEAWARWTDLERATYDAVPIEDGLAVVLVRAVTEGEAVVADTMPVIADGRRWLMAPLLDTGPFRLLPNDGSVVDAEPDLQVEVEPGVEVLAFVDGQEAKVGRSEGGTTTYRPREPLNPGAHLATVVMRRGDRITARTALYRVERP